MFDDSAGTICSLAEVGRTNKHCHRSVDLATNMQFISRGDETVRRGELLKQLLENAIELGG